MGKQLKIVSQTSLLLLFFLTQFCYGQKQIENQVDFIKVYSSQSFLKPPFEKKEIEISNNQISNRIVLPPRQKMNPEHLNKYNSINTKPDYQDIKAIDYDSIVNYILTSGLLNIDLNYTNPDTTGGVVIMKAGGGSYQYIIETSNGKLDLLISGGSDFIIPDILEEFDELFRRISSRYYGVYE